MNEIGIMQGRLVPAVSGRIQAFPWNSWESEFETAAAIGFDSIEFIFEGPDVQAHPLMSAEGRDAVRARIAATGVKVSSICADFFMPEPLFRGTVREREARLRVLDDLITAAAAVGAGKIEIPCVDESSLASERERDLLLGALRSALSSARANAVELLLETDLEPRAFADLLGRLEDPHVGANYDTGNSASLGYDAGEEIRAYGHRILNVHIKDRVLGGGTVPLGTGSANFPAVFAALRAAAYRDPFILQTARDPDDVGVARRYFDQVRQWVTELLAPAGAPA